MKKLLFTALVLVPVLTINKIKAQDMEKSKAATIELTGDMQPVNPDWFTGNGWLETLVDDTDTFGVSVANVVFEPGCRNHWHNHPGGQILIVTEGVGYYQERGKPVQILRRGDTVTIYPGVEHWHGATPNSWFSHLALGTRPEAGEAEWMEPVSDGHYNDLPG